MPCTRRDLLKMSVAGATLATAPPAGLGAMSPDSPRGEISVWATAGTTRHAPQAPLQWRPGVLEGGALVRVDPSREYQPILGFGAAFTEAACFTCNRLDPGDRKELFTTLFHPSQLGLSVSRVCVGSSDYATREYSYSEGLEPDPELQRFSIAPDREYVLPILREARAVNPDMFILASPWSPPAWMKPNKSMRGGSMRRSSLAPFARYMEKFLDAYAAEGVRVDAVTPQNEIDTEQDGRMPACTWPQEYEMEFVRDHLGPRLEKSANPADVWILDHNYNLWGRVLDELEDERMRRYVRGVAWHGYAGRPEQMMNVKRAHPDVDMFWTEGGPDWETGTYAVEWAKWADTFTGILRNQARCIIGWNYALDEQGNPNIGPFKCAGLITVDSKTRAISHSAMLWALHHFSGHIRRGARVVESSGESDVKHLVARNPGRDFVAVMTNGTTRPSTVTLAVGEASTRVELPADSVTTLAWR